MTLSGPCTDQGRTEPTGVLWATNVPVKFHLDQSTVGRMTAEKPVFDLQ